VVEPVIGDDLEEPDGIGAQVDVRVVREFGG
jgi:hypothetical protein